MDIERIVTETLYKINIDEIREFIKDNPEVTPDELLKEFPDLTEEEIEGILLIL